MIIIIFKNSNYNCYLILERYIQLINNYTNVCKRIARQRRPNERLNKPPDSANLWQFYI